MKKTNHGGKREGAGRPSLGKDKKLPITVRLRPDTRFHLDQYVDEREITFTEAVEKAIWSL